MFDDVQIEMMKKLETDKEIDSVLTFKSDGSLFGVTIIQKSSIYYDLFVNSCNNTNTILNIMFEMCKDLPFLAIPCSQNTFVFGEMMLDYYATAICANYGIDVSEMTALEAFMNGMPKLLESIIIFDKVTYAFPWVNSDLIKCLSFEAICKNRKSIWGNCHTELAINYEHSSLVFLGCTFNLGPTPGQYVPHYALKTIPHECNFNEPYWWSVTNGSVVQLMLDDVENVAKGVITDDMFFDKYPCDNEHLPKIKVIDYEGFVIMTQISETEYDYGKIKTRMYYNCHKLRKENIPWLLSLPDITEKHFPIIKTVKKFYISIESQCQAYILLCNQFIEECMEKTHPLILEQNSLSKMMQSFDHKDISTQKRIIIKAFVGSDKYLIAIFHETFGIDLDTSDIKFAINLAYEVIINDVNIYEHSKTMDRMFFLMNN
jgi:hypothetical protein